MYWKKPGKINTKDTIEIVKKAIANRGIKDVVFASSTGKTAKLFKDADVDANLVCVTHAYGFKEPGKTEFDSEIRNEIENAGIKVLTTTHVLSGAERGIRRKFGGVYPVEVIANSLRMLGQGTKVCVEIAVMALDAGMIPYGKEIIAVGGSDEGADTAVIIKPSHASNIFKTWISEILCKPYNKA